MEVNEAKGIIFKDFDKITPNLEFFKGEKKEFWAVMSEDAYHKNHIKIIKKHSKTQNVITFQDKNHTITLSPSYDDSKKLITYGVIIDNDSVEFVYLPSGKLFLINLNVENKTYSYKYPTGDLLCLTLYNGKEVFKFSPTGELLYHESPQINNKVLNEYVKELQRRIKMNWAPPLKDDSKIAILWFRIAKDGRLISEPIIYKSSGSIEFDKSAMTAVSLTAPFKPVPSNVKYIDIQFTFDYKTYKKEKGQGKYFEKEYSY